MTTLLIAEHDNSNLNESVKKAITAALSIGEKVDLLVAGNDCNSVANEAAKIAGVNKVLLCENDIQHTSNKNGIFVNISLLDEVSLMLLYNYINTSVFI